MLPWNYGFHWNTGTMVFLGAFYLVLAIVVSVVVWAALRSWRGLKANRADRLRWRTEFEEIPGLYRPCRHVFTRIFHSRTCQNAFDCRSCQTYAEVCGKIKPTPPGGNLKILGMTYPTDRLYHRGHTWAHREPDGSVTVGPDELSRRVMGKLDSIELPEPGQRVEVNGTAWRAHKGNAEVRVLCPVDGEVLETGGPDGDFYLKVKLDGDVRHLLRPPEIEPWIRSEVERMQTALSAAGVPTMADGGEVVSDVAEVYPEDEWGVVCGKMFLHP